MQEKIRPGYKQTEIGVIPEDWEIRGFSEALTVASGQVDPKQPPFTDMILVAPDHVEEATGRLIHKKRAREQGAISGKYRFGRGDIVYSKIRPYLRKLIFADFEGLCSADMYPLRAAPDVEAKFCYYVMSGERFSEFASAVSVRSGIPKINRDELAQFCFALPPLREQSAIAEALSDADARIAALEALIAKKRDLKQAAMQHLLTGKTRLPGFSGDWEVKRLGEVAHIKTGKRNNQDKKETGDFPFFVRSETVERIDSYSHDCEAILVPGEGNIGNIFHYIDGKFDVHQRVYAITQFAENVSGKYVHLWMRMNFGAHAMQNTVKATVDSLRLPTFQNFQLLMPPTIDEQTAVAEILSDMDTELAALEAEAEKARTIKQGMMQNLLTGKVRLV